MGIELKPTQIRALLKEHYFVYRRPKHDLTNLLFGAYNWVNDEVVYQVAEQRNSETFIAFLEHLIQQHAGHIPWSWFWTIGRSIIALPAKLPLPCGMNICCPSFCLAIVRNSTRLSASANT